MNPDNLESFCAKLRHFVDDQIERVRKETYNAAIEEAASIADKNSMRLGISYLGEQIRARKIK
jgi:hypothetical protein